MQEKISRMRSNSTENLFQNETCVCRTVLQKKRIRCVALKWWEISTRANSCVARIPCLGSQGWFGWSWIQSPPLAWRLFTVPWHESLRITYKHINTILPLKWRFNNLFIVSFVQLGTQFLASLQLATRLTATVFQSLAVQNQDHFCDGCMACAPGDLAGMFVHQVTCQEYHQTYGMSYGWQLVWGRCLLTQCSEIQHVTSLTWHADWGQLAVSNRFRCS